MPWLVAKSWAFLALNGWARSLLACLNVLALSDVMEAGVPRLASFCCSKAQFYSLKKGSNSSEILKRTVFVFNSCD